MAISKTNAVSVQSYDRGSYSTSYDAGSGDGRVLIVIIRNLYGVSNIKYNDVNLTLAQSGDLISMYYLIDPDEDSNTLYISFPNDSSDTAIYYYVLTGCHHSSPIGQKSTLTNQNVQAGKTLTMNLNNCSKNSFIVNCGHDYWNGSSYDVTWDDDCLGEGSLNGHASYFLLYSHKILSEDGTASIAYTVNDNGTHLCSLLCLEILSAATTPTVTTQAVDQISTTSVRGNGNITDTGGENCTRRGFCYKAGTSGDPTVADSVAYDDGSFGTGAFTKSITGLLPNTTYRVRAYAVNSAGTSYGTTVTVTTLSAFIPRTMWFN